jgi:cell division septation protein DedD
LSLLKFILAAVLQAAILASAFAAGGAEPAPKGPGLLTEIKRALSQRPAAEVWEEAVASPSTSRALPLMTGLLRRTSDPSYAGRAALWLGHYSYGAGRVEEALGYFEQSLQRPGDEATRAEAGFWAAQCRSLLGRPAQETGTGRSGVHAVLGQVVAHDVELRGGEIETAWRGYLSLEGDARQAGCVGPLLYRLGLIASAVPGRAWGHDSPWAVLDRLAQGAPAAPERALYEQMVPVGPTASEPPETEKPDAGSTPAAESGPAPEREATPAAAPAASSAPEAGTVEAGAGAPYYAVQLGAFIDGDRAEREYRRLQGSGLTVRLDQEEMNGRIYYKIRLGHHASRAEAEERARRECRGLDWQVVRISP